MPELFLPDESMNIRNLSTELPVREEFDPFLACLKAEDWEHVYQEIADRPAWQSRLLYFPALRILRPELIKSDPVLSKIRNEVNRGLIQAKVADLKRNDYSQFANDIWPAIIEFPLSELALDNDDVERLYTVASMSAPPGANSTIYARINQLIAVKHFTPEIFQHRGMAMHWYRIQTEIDRSLMPGHLSYSVYLSLASAARALFPEQFETIKPDELIVNRLWDFFDHGIARNFGYQVIDTLAKIKIITAHSVEMTQHGLEVHYLPPGSIEGHGKVDQEPPIVKRY